MSFVHDQSDDSRLLAEIVRLARINTAAGPGPGAKAPGPASAAAPAGVKARRLPAAELQQWEARVEAVAGKLQDRLQEDQVPRDGGWGDAAGIFCF